MKIEEIKVDSVLQYNNNVHRKVLGVSGKMAALSEFENCDKFGGWFTIDEINQQGWKIQPQPTLDERHPEGALVLVRDNVKDVWQAGRSTGKRKNGCLYAKIDGKSFPWAICRDFEAELIGRLTN